MEEYQTAFLQRCVARPRQELLGVIMFAIIGAVLIALAPAKSAQRASAEALAHS